MSLRFCSRRYFRGIVNPVGVKVGPSTVPSELVALIERLDPPPHTPGKVTLITRFGAEKVATMLPPIIEAVQAAALPVVWICDAVHGNTFKSSNGYIVLRLQDRASNVKRTKACAREVSRGGVFGR